MNCRQRRTIRRMQERRELQLGDNALKVQAEMIPNPTLTKEAHPWRDITAELSPEKETAMWPPHDKAIRWWHSILCHLLGVHCERCIINSRRYCCRCGGDLWL